MSTDNFDENGVKIVLDSESATVLQGIIENELSQNSNFGEYFFIKDIFNVVQKAIDDYFTVSPTDEKAQTPKSALFDDFTILQRYGNDDMSLWSVTLNREDFERVSKDSTRQIFDYFNSAVSTMTTVNESPNTLYFIFHPTIDYENKFVICTAKADDDFFNKYENCGWSVRGSIKDIFYEFNTLIEPETTVTLKLSEAMAVDSIISLNLCSTTDKQLKKSLEAANAKLEKAIGNCPLPEEFELEAETEDTNEI